MDEEHQGIVIPEKHSKVRKWRELQNNAKFKSCDFLVNNVCLVSPD